MTRWIPYAFVRLTLFLVAGIVVGMLSPFDVPVLFLAGGVLFCVFLYSGVFVLNRLMRRMLFNPGGIGLLAVFAAGFAAVGVSTEVNRADHIHHEKQSILYYEGVVVTAPEIRGQHWRMIVAVERLRTAAGWQHATGQVMLRMPRKDFDESFCYGDVLLIRGQPQRVPGPANPGEFDYRRYLGDRQIFHQQLVRKGGIRATGHTVPSYVMDAAIRTRQWADSTLRRYVHGEREQALAVGLVLGVTDGLDPELLHAYAATGTMHVLAVSGLHISILYLIIMVLLRPLQWLPPGYNRWGLAAASILLLWGYAFVTGLSPSVLRAVIMFTILLLAKLRRQPANIYNTLAASAFLLLLYNPYNLLSVGFQLSYVAVLGIVVLHPGISALWKPRAWVVVKLWQMTSLSVAAQLATFPLGLLYFHQFPNYFLPANFIAIPGSFVILVAGLLVLAVSVVPVVAGWVGVLLSWIISSMNTLIMRIEALPFSIVEDVYITALQCAILMGVIVSVVLLVQLKKSVYGLVMAVLVTGFTVLQWNHYFAVADVRKLSVYNITGYSALDLMDKGVVYFMADSMLRSDARKIRFHITPNRIQHKVMEVRSELPFQCSFPGMTVVAHDGLSILQLAARNYRLPKKVHVDVLILSHNAVWDLAEVLRHVEADAIVLDSSNTPGCTQRIMQIASKLNVSVHAVRYAGTFEKVF